MEFKVDVDLTGPILRGEAPAIMDRARQHIVDEVAETGKNMVVGRLVQVIRQPTPYYWTQIFTRREQTDRLIHDSGVVYGPYLEGVSERNRSTRFKGYRTFRLIAQELQRRAPDIADRVITDRTIPELEGM